MTRFPLRSTRAQHDRYVGLVLHSTHTWTDEERRFVRAHALREIRCARREAPELIRVDDLRDPDSRELRIEAGWFQDAAGRVRRRSPRRRAETARAIREAQLCLLARPPR